MRKAWGRNSKQNPCLLTSRCWPCFYCGQAMPFWAQFHHHKLNACGFMVSARSHLSTLLAQGSQVLASREEVLLCHGSFQSFLRLTGPQDSPLFGIPIWVTLASSVTGPPVPLRELKAKTLSPPHQGGRAQPNSRFLSRNQSWSQDKVRA